MRNALLVMLGSLVGAVAGVGATRLLGQPLRPEAAPSPATVRVESRPLAAEAQVTRAAVPALLPVTTPPSQTAPPPALSRPEDRLEQEREANAEHEAVLLEHEREPRDAAWAAERERSIGDQLGHAAEKAEMSVAGVDCRTHTCVARLRWSDVAAARTHLGTLLGETALTGCARRVQFPDTGTAPYEAQLLMDCPR